MKRRTDKPIDAASRRRLDALRAAPVEHSFTDLVLPMLVGQDVSDQSGHDLLAILHR